MGGLHNNKRTKRKNWGTGHKRRKWEVVVGQCRIRLYPAHLCIRYLIVRFKRDNEADVLLGNKFSYQRHGQTDSSMLGSLKGVQAPVP